LILYPVVTLFHRDRMSFVRVLIM